MVFWNKTKHKLPKFPPDVAPIFKQLCGNVDGAEQLSELDQAVDYRLEEIRKGKDKNPNLDLDFAQQLAECCHYLLGKHPDYPADKQALIIGAVRYFAVSDDPFDDTVFASGFFDDMKIMNHVLEKLGIDDRYFDVR